MRKKVLILGSCISRDVFNYDTDNSFPIVDYYARTSLISLYSGSKPLKDIDFVEQLSSSFQKKIITYDLQKVFVEKVGLLDFDILLIDIIDERFDIFVREDGSCYTLSSELLSTDFLDRHEGKRIIFGSDEHFSLWKTAWKDFVHHLKILNLIDKLVVTKSFYAKIDDKGNDYGNLNYSISKIDNINTHFEKMYRYMQKDLKSKQFLSSSKNLLGASEHMWGRSPFHYTEQYYHDVLVFLKKHKKTKTEKQLAYDPYAWHYKIHHYGSLKSIQRKNILQNGIHHFVDGNNQYIDILMAGLEHLKSSNYIMVCLTGAVSQREGKRAPFFAGIGISGSLQMPLISIADPTLGLDIDMAIAWYTGNKLNRDFPEKVAHLLDKIALLTKKKLLFFGGSGGGYASLLISSYIKSETLALIWNPQTKIEDYQAPIFVEKFKNTAMKEDETFENTDLKTSIRDLSIPTNVHILYLQNITDNSHCENHLYPYMKDRHYELMGNATLNSNNVVISLGDFGVGHAAPNHQLLMFLIEHLMKHENILYTAWELDQGIKNLLKEPPKITLFDVDKNDFPFDIVVEQLKAQVSIECRYLKGITGKQFKYAFYLLSNGERIDVIGYSNNNKGVFTLPLDKENFSLVCFVKDIFGVMRIKKVGMGKFVENSSNC